MLFALVFLGFSSFAKPVPESSPQKDFSKYEAIDMNQFKGLEPQKSQGINVKGSVGCTGANGVSYQANDPGFGTCMGEFEAEKSKGDGQKRGSTPSVGIQFGQ